MISLLLSAAMGGAAGFLLGRGVPRLVQRSAALVRRDRTKELLFASLLMVPWAVGVGAALLSVIKPWLLVWVLGYWIGLVLGRRRLGL